VQQLTSLNKCWVLFNKELLTAVQMVYSAQGFSMTLYTSTSSSKITRWIYQFPIMEM